MRLQIFKTARRFSTWRAAASFLADSLGREVSEVTHYCLTQSAKGCQCNCRSLDITKPRAWAHSAMRGSKLPMLSMKRFRRVILNGIVPFTFACELFGKVGRDSLLYSNCKDKDCSPRKDFADISIERRRCIEQRTFLERIGAQVSRRRWPPVDPELTERRVRQSQSGRWDVGFQLRAGSSSAGTLFISRLATAGLLRLVRYGPFAALKRSFSRFGLIKLP